MRRLGKRSGIPDQSQSAQANIALAGMRVVMASMGVSGDGTGDQEDAPVCRQTTVPVSSQAAKNGSQCWEWIDGSRSLVGNSGKTTALKPRAALARISLAATSGSGNQGSCRPMMRSG